MKIPRHKPRQSTRLVTVGKTGTGKSFFVKQELIRSWLDQGVRVVALDVCDEYSRHGLPRYGMACEGTLRDRVTLAQLNQNPDILKEPRLSLAVVPNGRTPREWAHAFLTLVRYLRAIGKPVMLVVDEVGRWTDSSADQRKPNKCHLAKIELASVATLDRKNGFALTVVSQSASHIPIDVRKQSDEWVCFLQDAQEDLEALEPRLGKEKTAEVSRLGLYQSLHWRDSTHAAPTAALKAV